MAGLYGKVTKTSAVKHFLVVATGECLDAKKDVLFGHQDDKVVNAGQVFTRSTTTGKEAHADYTFAADCELFVSKTQSDGEIAASCGTIAAVPGGTASIFLTTEFATDATADYTPGAVLYAPAAGGKLSTDSASGKVVVGRVASIAMVSPAQLVSLATADPRKTPVTVDSLVGTSVDPSTQLPILAFTLNSTATMVA